MTGQWELSTLRDPAQPQRIRPETHWFQETRPPHRVSGEEYGRVDGGLWFSLQLTLDRAEQLCNAFASSPESKNFAELVNKRFVGPNGEEQAVMMAPASYAALRLAIEAARADLGRQSANYCASNFPEAEKTEPMLGTDILVHPEAFSELEKLSRDRVIEIADAGLAVEGYVAQPPLEKDFAAKSTPMRGPIPKGSPVIIATIDDGIGIANHRFREAATTTRVKHFLDLALIGKPRADGWVDELLGRSWKGANIDKIDKILGQDEEQVYRALGLIDPLRDLRQPLRAALSHGTHVLDLAAGYNWRTEREIAKSRPIIAVQLPSQVAENLSDTWLAQCLKRALDWILVKADELSAKLSESPASGRKPRRLPLIVNGSFASMAGPQDGTSDVERRITQFVETYRGKDASEDLCTVVLAAGNSLQLRDAARMDIGGYAVGEISWRLQPDDKTPNFVQIWLPKFNDVGDQDRQEVEVSLVPPPGNAPAKPLASKLNKAVEWKIGDQVGARIYHQRFRRSDGSRECITIATRPTADDQQSEPVVVVPSGLWQIKIKNIGQRELCNIDLQIHRNDVGIFSRSGARQSYFDESGYVMFDPRSGRIINDELKDPTRGTRVTRQGTLSSYAYAKGVLAVGGYRRSDGQPATYSSSGRCPNDCTVDAKGSSLDWCELAAVLKEDPASASSSSASGVHYRTHAEGSPLDGPDLAAVSEESPALPGVLATGTYSGSVAILAGTSVAAPQVTRALADQITRPATAAIAGQESKTGGAAEELKAKVVARENTVVPRAPGLRPRHDHYKPHRPLRDGVGRLLFTFKSSYPKRTDD